MVANTKTKKARPRGGRARQVDGGAAYLPAAMYAATSAISASLNLSAVLCFC
jgi:hypothetical protein